MTKLSNATFKNKLFLSDSHHKVTFKNVIGTFGIAEKNEYCSDNSDFHCIQFLISLKTSQAFIWLSSALPSCFSKAQLCAAEVFVGIAPTLVANLPIHSSYAAAY